MWQMYLGDGSPLHVPQQLRGSSKHASLPPLPLLVGSRHDVCGTRLQCAIVEETSCNIGVLAHSVPIFVEWGCAPFLIFLGACYRKGADLVISYGVHVGSVREHFDRDNTASEWPAESP
jgi:hypothetical protein